MKCTVITQSPERLSKNDLGDFTALVRAGGEVKHVGLEDRVRKAKQLIFLRVENCLAGIGALKKPNANYRKRVACKSGVDLPTSAYPLEFGWVFISPSYRGRGYANRITEAGVYAANGAGIFATSRRNNGAMHSALKKHGFCRVGKAYQSPHGDHQLRLFIRQPSKESTFNKVRASRGRGQTPQGEHVPKIAAKPTAPPATARSGEGGRGTAA